MWNTRRRKKGVNRRRLVNRNRGMQWSILLVVVVVIMVIFTNVPEKAGCMSKDCKNHRCEDSVYCAEHQQEFEEYKSKAYSYENCTITYKGDVVHE